MGLVILTSYHKELQLQGTPFGEDASHEGLLLWSASLRQAVDECYHIVGGIVHLLRAVGLYPLLIGVVRADMLRDEVFPHLVVHPIAGQHSSQYYGEVQGVGIVTKETGISQGCSHGKWFAQDSKSLAQHRLHGILALHAILGHGAEEVALGLVGHHISYSIEVARVLFEVYLVLLERAHKLLLLESAVEHLLDKLIVLDAMHDVGYLGKGHFAPSAMVGSDMLAQLLGSDGVQLVYKVCQQRAWRSLLGHGTLTTDGHYCHAVQ